MLWLIARISHGYPIETPRWTSEDHYLIARMIDSSYLTESYEQDKFLVYESGDPKKVIIAGKERWLYAPSGTMGGCKYIYQPTDKQWQGGPISRGFRWETKIEFEERAKRNRKCAESYEGNHDWHPPHWRYKRRLYIWFDIRRVMAIAAAVWMMFVHIMLLIK